MSGDRAPPTGQNARLLRALIWAALGLAPVAAVVVMVGGGHAARFAVVLTTVSVVLIGAALLVRTRSSAGTDGRRGPGGRPRGRAAVADVVRACGGGAGHPAAGAVAGPGGRPAARSRRRAPGRSVRPPGSGAGRSGPPRGWHRWAGFRCGGRTDSGGRPSQRARLARTSPRRLRPGRPGHDARLVRRRDAAAGTAQRRARPGDACGRARTATGRAGLPPAHTARWRVRH